MAVARTLIQDVPADVTDPTAPLWRPDYALTDDGWTPDTPAAGGVDCLYDLVGGSWPSGLDPANNDPVLDRSEKGNHATFVRFVGGTIPYVGGGFDFADAGFGLINVPPAFADSVHASPQQYFHVALYVRLPPEDNWPTDYVRPLPFLTWTVHVSGFSAEVDLLSLNMVTTGVAPNQVKALRVVRPRDGTTSFDVIDVPVSAPEFGSVVQFGYWRNAASQTGRLQSAAGVSRVSIASGQNNPANFAGKIGRLGIGAAVWDAAKTSGRQWRVYRALFENLYRSGRDPEEVLADDWLRVVQQRQMPFS